MKLNWIVCGKLKSLNNVHFNLLQIIGAFHPFIFYKYICFVITSMQLINVNITKFFVTSLDPGEGYQLPKKIRF